MGARVAYGGEGTGHGETITTGSNLVARVPDSVAMEHACFSTLGSIAMNSVRIANIGLGDVVVVLGLGLVESINRAVGEAARRSGHRHGSADQSYRSGSPDGRTLWISWRTYAARCRRERDEWAWSRLRDCRGGREVRGSVPPGTRGLPRSRAHGDCRRCDHGVSVERHVHERNSALHVARVWPRQLRSGVRKAGTGLPGQLCSLDRESQHAGIPAAGFNRRGELSASDHAHVSARRDAPNVRIRR